VFLRNFIFLYHEYMDKCAKYLGWRWDNATTVTQILRFHRTQRFKLKFWIVRHHFSTSCWKKARKSAIISTTWQSKIPLRYGKSNTESTTVQASVAENTQYPTTVTSSLEHLINLIFKWSLLLHSAFKVT